MRQTGMTPAPEEERDIERKLYDDTHIPCGHRNKNP